MSVKERSDSAPPSGEALVQVLFPGSAARTRLGPLLRPFGGAAREELVDERGNLADLGIAEMAREQRRDIVDRAPALHFPDRIGSRSDEHPAVLVLAVLLVVADLDRRRLP